MRSSATRLTAGIESICSGCGQTDGRRSSRRGVWLRRPGPARRRCRPSRSRGLRRRRSPRGSPRPGRSPASTACVAPSSRASSSLAGTTSTATMRSAPASTAPSSAASPTPPRPNTATLSPGSTRAVVHHCAHPGEHRAAEQRGDLVRQVAGDPDGRGRADHDVVGEGGDAEVVMDLAAGILPPAPLAREQGPGGVGRGARLAQRSPPVAARRAAAAGRHEGEHDVVARGERGDAGAEPRRPRRRLRGPRAIGITRGREPSMTERSEWHRPAAWTLISSSPGPGRRELEFGDLQGPRLSVGRAAPHLAQHRAANPHDATTRRSSAARSGAGIGAGRRVSRSTKTWTNQPVAAGSSSPCRKRRELVRDARGAEPARPAARRRPTSGNASAAG